MNEIANVCHHCGGPVVRLPECRWCGMVIATIGRAADRLWGEYADDPCPWEVQMVRRSDGVDCGEDGP